MFVLVTASKKVCGQIMRPQIMAFRHVSIPSDYYRSKNNGDWAAAATWESSADNISWINATAPPTSAANAITIQAAHTVNITTVVSLDQATINGMLDVRTGAVINISDGPGSDINVASNGILRVTTNANYNSVFIYAAAASINIAGNGKISIGDGTAAAGLNYSNGMHYPHLIYQGLLSFRMPGLQFQFSGSHRYQVFLQVALRGLPSMDSLK